MPVVKPEGVITVCMQAFGSANERGLKTERSWEACEAMPITMVGEIKLLVDIVKQFNNDETALPAFPGIASHVCTVMNKYIWYAGVVELPAPYQDYAIILDKQCVGSLLNDCRGSEKEANVAFGMPGMQVTMIRSLRKCLTVVSIITQL